MAIAIGWLFVGSFIVVLGPTYESRAALGSVGRQLISLTFRSQILGGIVKDAFGQRPGKAATTTA